MSQPYPRSAYPLPLTSGDQITTNGRVQAYFAEGLPELEHPCGCRWFKTDTTLRAIQQDGKCPFCEFRFFEPWSFERWFESLRPVDVTTLTDDVCGICQDQYGQGIGEDHCFDPLLLQCGHHFGSTCLKNWLSPSPEGNGNSCPNCRCKLFEAWPVNDTRIVDDNGEASRRPITQEERTRRLDEVITSLEEMRPQFDELQTRIANSLRRPDILIALESEEQHSDLEEQQEDQREPSASSEVGADGLSDVESNSDEEWDPSVMQNRVAWLLRQQYTNGPEDERRMLRWLQVHNGPVTDNEIHDHWYEEYEPFHHASHVQRGSGLSVESPRQELRYEISRDENAEDIVATYRRLRLDEQAFRQAQSNRLREIMRGRNDASREAYNRNIEAWMASERHWTANLTERLGLFQ